MAGRRVRFTVSSLFKSNRCVTQLWVRSCVSGSTLRWVTCFPLELSPSLLPLRRHLLLSDALLLRLLVSLCLSWTQPRPSCWPASLCAIRKHTQLSPRQHTRGALKCFNDNTLLNPKAVKGRFIIIICPA